MIDVTSVDMVKFVQKVYELSQPQGMGMIHYQSGGLTDDEAKSLIQSDGTVSMDYVKGRACKMYVTRKEGRLIILRNNWYDHTDEQMAELLEFVGLSMTTGTLPDEHGESCNCASCRERHGLESFDSEKDFKKAIKAHEDGTAFKITALNPDGE